MKPKVYISIPITGRDVTAQREKSDRVKSMLSKRGCKVVNPFDVYCGKDPGYDEHLCYDLLALAKCDAIYLCDGWQYSKGCRIEAFFAKEYHKQFMYETEPHQPSEYYFER